MVILLMFANTSRLKRQFLIATMIDHDEIVQRVFARAFALLKVDFDTDTWKKHAESIQVVVYNTTQEYQVQLPEFTTRGAKRMLLNRNITTTSVPRITPRTRKFKKVRIGMQRCLCT